MSVLESKGIEKKLSGFSFLSFLYKNRALSQEGAIIVEDFASKTEVILDGLDKGYVGKVEQKTGGSLYYLTEIGKIKVDKCLNILDEDEKYYSFEELIDMIVEPHRALCIEMYEDNKDIFDKAKGSSTKHQAWEGGYIDHIVEVMNIAVREYNDSILCRELEHSLSDALLVLFLHDLEKPWKYAGTEEQKKEFSSYDNYKDFIENKLETYGFVLTGEHLNGLKYIHGEGDDYDPKKRVQLPLAAFAHICDTKSGRIWPDEPKERGKW